MGDILLRDVDPEVVSRLKARARGSRQSVAAEIRSILDDATRYSLDEFLEFVDAWQAEDWGEIEDPTLVVREGRDR